MAPPIETQAAPASIHERIRAMSLPEMLRLARSGELSERIALERMHGKLVWEALLQNPRLTVPEVIRIANNGTIPQTLVKLLVANEAWLSSEQVRRVLLTNPRLRGQAVFKVLRALPKAELAVVPRQTAYPWHVREAAKRMLKT